MKEKDSNFKAALAHINSDDPLQSVYLHMLSIPTKANLADFKAIWPQIEADRRQKIMKMLVTIAEANFEVDFDPIFILGMDDPEANVQVAAINGLWENEDPALIPALTYLLKNSPHMPVRVAAAQSVSKYMYLGELEEIDSTALMVVEQALLEAIKNPEEDLEVRRRALESISFSGQDTVLDLIADAYEHEDDLMQISAIFAMGRNSHKKWGSTVLAALDDERPEIRFEAARACGELSLIEATYKLIKMIDVESDIEIQLHAIWALGQIGGHAAEDTLEILIDSSNEALAREAEDALDELLLFKGVFTMIDADPDLLDEFDDEDDEDDEDLFDDDYNTFYLGPDKANLN